jgi:hypothetical protein
MIHQLGSTLSSHHFGAKLAKPFGTAPPTLILDPVFLIRIDSHDVLFIDVYLLKYSYSETRLRCVNKSFIINCTQIFDCPENKSSSLFHHSVSDKETESLMKFPPGLR